MATEETPTQARAVTADGRDLSELLRSMTTTTTIETFDDPNSAPNPTTMQSTSTPTALPPFEIPSDTTPKGPFLPHVSAVPVSISRSYKIWGIPTHIFCQLFSDRIVVGVTQLQTKQKSNTNESTPTSSVPSPSGHIGSWVYCQASRSQIDPKQVDYELSTLLGGGTSGGGVDEKEVYARRVAERLLEKKSIQGGTDRIVILLGISLLPIPSKSASATFSSMDRFQTLVEVLVELVEEALGIALG